jgi:two-component system, oxyanion-binding sensor
MSLQKQPICIGYAPLNDAAPLVMAHELGLFAEYGLDVRLQRQSSWATAKDLLAIGALDGAHMLAPVVLASQSATTPSMFAPLVLSLCGNSIVVSRALFQSLLVHEPLAGQDAWATARAIARVATERKKNGQALLRFGVVFRQSGHYLDLRRLLIAGGADPDTDVSLAVVPPQETEKFLEQGLLDGFSAGEPWGSFAVQRGYGVIVASGHELWPNRIDKVLAFRAGFDKTHLQDMTKLVQATMQAAKWLETPHNRRAAAAILVDRGYLDVPFEAVLRGLTGQIDRGGGMPKTEEPDYVVFDRYGAGFPWHSQGAWIARDMQVLDVIEQGDLGPRVQFAFRTDLFKLAAAGLGVDAPAQNDKPETCHKTEWTLDTIRADGSSGAPLVMAPDQRFDMTPSSNSARLG